MFIKRIKSISSHSLIGWLLLFIIVIIFIIAVLTEINFISAPEFLINKTSDNLIYQTLFTAQASLVGVVLAIITVVSTLSDTRIYGMSTRKYATEVRPLLPFRLRWIFIESLTLTTLSWIFVALSMNNLAVGLFIITILLLGYFVVSTLNTVVFADKAEKYIKSQILSSKDYTTVENIFINLKDNISYNEKVGFDKNILFITTELLIKLYSMNRQDIIDNLQDNICIIIKTVKDGNASFISGVLELCISIFNNANEVNKSGRKIKLDKLIDFWSMYILVSRLPISDLDNDNKLLSRFQNCLFQYTVSDDSMVPYSNRHSMLRSYSSVLLHRVKENHYLTLPEKETAISLLLMNVQAPLLYGKPKSNREIAFIECEFINYIVTLFVTKEENILRALYGLEKDAPHWHNFKPAITRYGRQLTKEHFYIVLYMYYIGYYENIVSEEEKLFCQNLLQSINDYGFWNELYNHAKNNDELLNFMKEYSKDFSELLERHARWEDTGFGSGSRSGSVREVSNEFLLFCLVGLTREIDVLEQGIKRIIMSSSEDAYFSFFSVFNSYIVNSEKALELYKRFVDIFGSYSQVDYDFECFKTAITNLYRDECLHEAAVANEKFNEIKQLYHDILFSDMKERLNNIEIIFAAFDENEADSADDINYETITFTLRDSSPFNMSNPEDAMKHTASYIADECERLLFLILFKETKNKLQLLNVSRGYGKTTISEFYKQIGKLSPTLLVGVEKFKWNDPDYEKYKSLVETIKTFRQTGVLIAFDSKRIKLSINSMALKIKKLSSDEISERIETDKVISVTGNHYISVREEDARTYLENKYQVAEVTFSVAIKCKGDNVGGGFIYE